VIVTSHSAFGYLADRYRLEQYGVAGLEPEAEPSAARVAEVQEVIGKASVTTLYAEPLASAESVETIAGDLGLNIATLDPLESLREPTSADYFTVMRENLSALRAGLRCS
jgi:zinc transport system substrate-binding protein